MFNSKTLKVLVSALIIAVVPVVAFAVPQFPHSFYGIVAINGGPAPIDTVIIAQIGGVEKGRITTIETGKYGGRGAYDQKLLVQGDDLQTGDMVVFTISGVSGTPTALFESGKVEELNIAFVIATPTPTPSSTPTPNPGGGGGAPPSTPTPTPTATPLNADAQKVDSNHDGKIDVLDFNALMINWGSTSADNPADFNDDGKVDILDFNLLMIYWS